MNTIKSFTDAELGTLDIRVRNILTAHVCNGKTYKEAALANDVPIGTVRSRISRARAKIAKLREAVAAKAAQAEQVAA